MKHEPEEINTQQAHEKLEHIALGSSGEREKSFAARKRHASFLKAIVENSTLPHEHTPAAVALAKQMLQHKCKLATARKAAEAKQDNKNNMYRVYFKSKPHLFLSF